MGQLEEDLYFKGYLAGYRTGIKDAVCGKITIVPDDAIAALPLQAMALSTRANHCLHRAGCTCIGDVAVLKEQTIASMRKLGPKTASEIARWLDNHHIYYTAWEKYL